MKTNGLKPVLRRFLSLMLTVALLLPYLPQTSLTAYAAVSGTLTGLSNEDIIATYTGTDDGANSSWSVTGGNSISPPLLSRKTVGSECSGYTVCFGLLLGRRWGVIFRCLFLICVGN